MSSRVEETALGGFREKWKVQIQVLYMVHTEKRLIFDNSEKRTLAVRYGLVWYGVKQLYKKTSFMCTSACSGSSISLPKNTLSSDNSKLALVIVS